MPDTFDWSNQVVESLWWIAWVFVVTTVGFAVVVGMLLRVTSWGRQVARLAVPYFTPGKTWFSWRPLLTVLLLLLLTVMAVRLDVLFTYQSNGLYTALQELNVASFTTYLEIFGVIATIHVIRSMFSYYITNMFLLHWRIGLNERLVDDWIDGQAFYRGQYVNEPIDNPEQRIQEDITSFTTNSQNLAIGATNSMVSVVSFSIILWELSAPLTLFGFEISRAMIFITYVYVTIATVIAFKIGHPLVRLHFLNERFNASYRYTLVRLHDNAENIALYRGDLVERATLMHRFGAIIINYWALIFRNVKFQSFNLSVSQLANVFPIIVQAPRFFSGAIKLGDLQQTASAFSSVHDSLSFFRESYDSFAGYRATLDRLTGLLDVNTESRAMSRVPIEERSEGVQVRGLTVRRPDGREMVKNLSLEISVGDALVVHGGSGSGKTSLLRSLAGFWPYTSGSVSRPIDNKALFLSQQPYLPFGSLRTAMAYPEPPEFVSDERAREVLHQVFLGHLVDSLDEDKIWWRILSPGEQQRIGFARILINRPSVAFLDESTSSVDEGLEFALYTLIREQLPECTLFSVGHRSTLNRLHSHHLELLPDGQWSLAMPVGQ